MLRQVLHLCNQQLHLIERVFAIKQLGDPVRRRRKENQAWIALFRRWCQVPRFQLHWALHIGRLDASFVRFCLEEFQLEFRVGFEKASSDCHIAHVEVQGGEDPLQIPVGYLEQPDGDTSSDPATLVIDERYSRRSLTRRFEAAARGEFEIQDLEVRSEQLDLSDLTPG